MDILKTELDTYLCVESKGNLTDSIVWNIRETGDIYDLFPVFHFNIKFYLAILAIYKNSKVFSAFEGRDEKDCKLDVDHRPDIKEQDGWCWPVEKGSGRRRPAIKEQDGWHQLRKVQWSTSTALFMTNCMVKNLAK